MSRSGLSLVVDKFERGLSDEEIAETMPEGWSRHGLRIARAEWVKAVGESHALMCRGAREVPVSAAERLEKYVQWNQLTRHQIIVAHMTLIDSADDAAHRLAQALDTTTTFGLHQLVGMAIDRINLDKR